MPFSFAISNKAGHQILATQPANTLLLNTIDPITHVRSFQTEKNATIFATQTEKKNNVKIVFTFLSATHFSVSLLPEIPPDSLAQNFQIQPYEHFYGFGERLEGYLNADFDQRGTKVSMWRLGTQGVYVPFFMSTAGYGIFIRNSEKGHFDLGKKQPEILNLRYSASELTYDFFYGPEFPKILDRFTEITGRPWIPPIWAFEPWKWRNEVKGDWEIYEDAERLRHLDLPAGMTLIDRPHFSKVLDFRFNPVQFPNPQRLMNDLHCKGLRAILWAVPFVERSSPQFAEGAGRGYFLKYKSGKPFSANDLNPEKPPKPKQDLYFVDFTNPAAAKWWKNALKKMVRMGFDGFKLDRSDELLPAFENIIYFNGRNAREMYNEYATLYAKVFWEACSEIRGNDFVVLSRPGFSGAQQYAIFFSGDTNPTWEHFQFNLFTMLRASLSGFPMWAQQLGGYRCKDRFGISPTPECFLRWVQMGCFSPFFDRGGSWFEEPWDYDENTLNIFRYYAKLHTELVPYIYSLAQQAHETGLPLVRPMVLLDQKNPDYWNLKDQYLFGDDFLVAPIIDSTSNRRKIILPAGRWRNYWNTQEILEGPRQISRTSPLEELPLFIREGAIIPLRVKDDDTGHGAFFSKNALTVEIYPADSSRFILNLANKSHVIEAVKTPNTVRLRFSENDEPLIFRVKLDVCPNNVQAGNGKSVTRKRQLLDLAEQSGWFFDDEKNWLWIKVNDTGDLALSIQQHYRFVDWQFEKSIFQLQTPVEIQLKIIGKPVLKNPELVFQADFDAEKKISPAKVTDRLNFSLPLAKKFEGQVKFYVQGVDAENQPVYSPTQFFIVDSDTTGPLFHKLVFPDSGWSDAPLIIQAQISDPSGVSRSEWGHGTFQIYWTVGDSSFHSFGEQLKDVFRNKNLNRYPKFKNGFFNFTIPQTHVKNSSFLEFFIEAWDYDKTPTKSRSQKHKVWIQARE